MLPPFLPPETEAWLAGLEPETAVTYLRAALYAGDPLLASSGLEALLRELLARVQRVLHADAGAIVLAERSGETLVVRVAAAPDPQREPELRLATGALARRIAGEGRPLVLDVLEGAVVEESRAFGLPPWMRYVLGAPLLAGESLAGVLCLARTEPQPFTRDDLLLLQLIASRAAPAIEQARRHEAAAVALRREQEARRRAEAAVRERDELLSIASHELRTPITVLRGYVQLVKHRVDRPGELDRPWVQSMLEAIVQQADKLTRLTGQLLDLSRLASGKLALDRQPTDLALLVEDIVRIAGGDEGGSRIVVHRPPEPVIASVDPLRFEEVVLNLLDNAIKYSPEGGEITVEVRPPRGGQAQLAVRDRGPGIPEAHRAHIFQRFYQAPDHAPDGTRSGGMGLGLYICRQIVERHGGTITAEFPDDGQGGTCFVVSVPVGTGLEPPAYGTPEQQPRLIG